jgi:hypothetical protein
VIAHPWFEQLVLLLILASCIQLALDDNGVDPTSSKALVREGERASNITSPACGAVVAGLQKADALGTCASMLLGHDLQQAQANRVKFVDHLTAVVVMPLEM